jgi:Amt family ammonium transporter
LKKLSVVGALVLFGSPSVASAQQATPAINQADTAWMLVATALVLLMTPALAFFYGGLVRSKNALNTMMMSVISLGFVSVVWAIAGYSLAFAPGNAILGDLSRAFLRGVALEPQGTIPHALFMAFQGTFAIITAALISGAIVERMRFSAYVTFISLWALLVYSPIAHWVWGGGWLSRLGALDFAGGTVVHVNAAVAALVAAIVVGKRTEYPSPSLIPHNVPFTLLGAGLLWFGWFGFNAGSAGAANAIAVNAFVVTTTAASTAALAWVIMSWWVSGKPSVVGAAAGAVAGLVAITPASGYVQPMESIAIGAGAGILCFLAVQWRTRSSLDDSLDVVAVHGVGGLWGAIATGIFVVAASESGVTAAEVEGLVNGGTIEQVWRQAVGVAAVAPFSFVVTFIILKVLDLTVGIRVNEEDEIAGLDVSQHGERAYVFGGSGPVLGIPEAIPVHTSASSAQAAVVPSTSGAAQAP